MFWQWLKNSTFLFFILSSVLFGMGNTIAQTPMKLFQKEQFNLENYSSQLLNKKIPNAIRKQILTALAFYPELKDSKIIFRLKKRKTPLTSRPRISTIFRRKKNRTYVITISTKTNDELAPILFQNLPYNAQIGVIGHELGHVVEYNSKNSFQIIRLSFEILNSKFVDSFEFNTDRIAIEHGLGYQLYDWSVYVRKALNIKEWQGASKEIATGSVTNVNQRYMNPQTIKKHMEEMSTLYKSTD